MGAKELVEYVARSLVDDPAAVTVEVIRDPDGTVIELHVAEDDMGKVIRSEERRVGKECRL